MSKADVIHGLEHGLLNHLKGTGLSASRESFSQSMRTLFSEHEKIVNARKKISVYSIHRNVEAGMQVYSTETDSDKTLNDIRRGYKDDMIEALRQVDADPVLLGHVENAVNYMKNILMREPKSEYAALLKNESPELAKKIINVEYTPFFGEPLVRITELKKKQDLIDLETEDAMYGTYEQLKLQEKREKNKPDCYM